MLLYKAKKGTKKTNQKKKQEKKIVGALIAYVYWVSLALVKMRIIRHNQNKKKKKKMVSIFCSRIANLENSF